MAVTNPSLTLNALIDLGIVTQDEASAAHQEAASRGTSTLEVLHWSGLVTDTQIVQASCHAAGVAFHSLVDLNIDPDTLTLIPGEVARRHTVIPLTDLNGTLTVAVPHKRVGDLILRDDLARISRRRVAFAVAMRDDITSKINRLYRAEAELNELAHDFDEVRGAGSRQAAAARAADITDTSEADPFQTPIIRFADKMIEQAITDRASDIHLDPDDQGVTIRYRIDGVLKVSTRQPLSMVGPLISRIKVMADMDIAERRTSQGGRITFPYKGRKIDLRVVALPTIHSFEKLVLRILDNSTVELSLQAQGFSDVNLQRFESAYKKKKGLVLVTGTTGAGKSTTLYTAVQNVATPAVNVVTVEDPVERIIPGVSQTPINERAGVTFASVLRDFLRADPNVILVGEVRDPETAHLAVRGALTGHLVLSTIHANDAAGTLTRLVDMGIAPFLVASSVQAAVSQALVRRLCIACRIPHTLTEDEVAALPGFPWTPGEPLPTIYQAREGGCNACVETGYKGRIAVHEVMTMTPEIARLTVENATTSRITEKAIEQGMVPLVEDGWAKVAAGITSIDEILSLVV